MLTNKSDNRQAFPDAYAQSKSPNSLWWLRFSTALGYRDIPMLVLPEDSPLQKRVVKYAGYTAEIGMPYKTANVWQIVKCFEDYLQFPNVRLSRDLRSIMRDCVEAWTKGGVESFCERWNEGEYLLPNQNAGQTIEDYLNLTKQEELL